ncbi:hypothetical protein [Cellulosimicrobium sp. TH-20]|uniref:deoxynucleotide monophosphate kinase family protein n=1 Tax=Cellulosimicrobium sp. TH-20 TaxID=1980001 RepID=UPI00119D5412|nr:hypothetical protein [Cellulosimicrobium sp. TH-20]
MAELIGMSGRKQSGKNTFAAHLVREYDYVEVAFADALRDMALAIDPIVRARFVLDPHDPDRLGRVEKIRLSAAVKDLGWDRAKELVPEVRLFLQRLGTDGVRRIIGEDIWVDTLSERISKLLWDGRDVVVTDVRFPNEARLIKRLSGFLVRVERPGLPHDEHPHVSEVALDDFADFDFVVQNDRAIEDLHRKADLVTRSIARTLSTR